MKMEDHQVMKFACWKLENAQSSEPASLMEDKAYIIFTGNTEEKKDAIC